MPEIKEKPKAGKPKGRRKSAGPPRQAGRLMKEKLVREVDQRKEREAENGSYAVDQVVFVSVIKELEKGVYN